MADESSPGVQHLWSSGDDEEEAPSSDSDVGSQDTAQIAEALMKLSPTDPLNSASVENLVRMTRLMSKPISLRKKHGRKSHKARRLSTVRRKPFGKKKKRKPGLTRSGVPVSSSGHGTSSRS